MKRIYPDYAYTDQPRERCYWPSTVAAPDFPVAEGEITADVAVIGAGFTGLTAAQQLAEAGEDVVVLEAQTPGWGASGRNGGFCCLGGAAASGKMLRKQYGEAARQEFRQAEAASVAFAKSQIARLQIDCDTHSKGETLFAHNQAALDGLEAHAEEALRDYGVECEIIPGNKLAANGMNGPFLGALTNPIGVALNPLKYTLGLARAGQAAGARIYGQSPVQGIEQLNGFTLSTPQARIRARRIVVATNGYSSDDLPEWMGSRYLPVQSNVIVTREMSDEEIAAQGWSTRQMSYDDRFFLHYFRLMPNNRMLFGTRGGYGSSAQADVKAFARVRRHFEEMFPAWAHVETPYQWHGLLAFSRDLTPYTGPIPEMQGAWTSMCYHGNGVAMGSYAGALLADQMLGRKDLRLHPAIMQKPKRKFPLGRFRRAALWPVYATAMLRGE